MARQHDRLVTLAKEAIRAVFSDQSVGRATTRESLGELADEVQSNIDAVSDDDIGDDEEP
jgi:hypothetical protein